jgi:hypothetical protein
MHSPQRVLYGFSIFFKSVMKPYTSKSLLFSFRTETNNLCEYYVFIVFWFNFFNFFFFFFFLRILLVKIIFSRNMSFYVFAFYEAEKDFMTYNNVMFYTDEILEFPVTLLE